MIKSRRLDSHWDNKGHVVMNLIKGTCFTGTAPMMPGDWGEFLGIHRQAVQAGVLVPLQCGLHPGDLRGHEMSGTSFAF